MAIRRKVSISERRACRLVGLSRSVLHYEAQTAPGNEILKARLVELAHERRRFGYRRLHVLLEREGLHANHKRVHL
ncbi:integrase [Ralstonia solanacearum]|nr:SAM-dependent methyltransferase [Ralstonia solanacearum]ARU22562.1 integrase [Ralstonia solanacearum]